MVRKFTRRSAMCGGLALAASGVVLPNRRIYSAERGKLAFAGVNLAGAEFGKVPGKHATDYTYPTGAQIEYFAKLDFNLIRVPFRWERLQPTLGGPFARDEQDLLTAVVDTAMANGLHVVLDAHNYARRRLKEDDWKKEHFIGSDLVTVDAFADFCSRLANAFKARSGVIFGLMNEPAGIEVEQWLVAANDGVAAIRKSGAENLILVPGVAYTGAHSWISARNTEMRAISDPGDNFAFEVHQYLDSDSSGTTPRVARASTGSERISAFQTWARQNHFKAFLGEFAAAEDELSLRALHDLCRTMEANSDVWIGWAAWAGGAWWPEDYMFNLEPSKAGRMRPQTRMLSDCARRIRSN